MWIGIDRCLRMTMLGGRRCHRCKQQLGVIGRRAAVRVFLRNGFALLGHAEGTTKRAMRQGLHEPMRGARTTADRAATTMEKHRAHRMFRADG